MVKTIVNNKNKTTKFSFRKALRYSGCSKNMYYGNKGNRYAIATASAVTAVTAAATSSTTMIEQEIQKISLQRSTYGTRRMAAMLTRVSGIPINRKRVQRIFRKIDGLHYTR